MEARPTGDEVNLRSRRCPLVDEDRVGSSCYGMSCGAARLRLLVSDHYNTLFMKSGVRIAVRWYRCARGGLPLDQTVTICMVVKPVGKMRI